MSELRNLFAELEEDGDSVQSQDSEIDGLLVNSILMLRTHLIELSKVFDLCSDFKLKYMQSLKKKMSQETMIGLSADSDDDSGSPTTSLEINEQVTIPLSFFNSTNIHTSPSCSTATPSKGSPKTNLHSHQEPKPKLKDSEKSTSRRSEKTFENRVPCHQSVDEDERCELKRKLPTKAVDTLKSWFYQHNTHPYPSDNEKIELSKETGLHITQINNWFINARRRIISTKATTNTSTNDSEEASDTASDWSPSAKKRRKDPKVLVPSTLVT